MIRQLHRKHFTVLLAGLSLAPLATAADLVWDATGDAVSLFQEANWVDQATGQDPSAGTVDPNVVVNRALVINSGTPGGPNGASGNLDLGPSGSLNMTAGTLRFAPGQGIRNNGPADAAGHPAVSISGGTVIAEYAVDVAVTLSGDSTLNLNGASDPISANATINLASGSATLRFYNRTVANVVASHLGEILVNGAPAVAGGDPGAAEPGDNVIITPDGNGCVVRQIVLASGLCFVNGACSVTPAAACTGVFIEGATTCPPPRQGPPNIVYIMVDDSGWGDYAAFGPSPLSTPNISALAAGGMKFTNAYAGGAVCTPSRSALLTGRHLGHARVRGNTGGISISASDPTIASVLHAAGYATGGFGKWGLGGPGSPGVPERHGFDTYFGHYHQIHAHSHYTDTMFADSQPVPMPANVGFTEPSVGLVDPSHTHTQFEVVDRLKKFVAQNVVAGRPFFAYGTWNLPHSNSTIPSNDPAYAQYASEAGWTAQAKIQAAMISIVDRNIGEVMQTLHHLGIESNTLFIFTSDNGGETGTVGGAWARNRNLRGLKGVLYEGGIRTPLIASWPGHIAPGTSSSLMTCFIDIMPTLADVAGANAFLPANIDGLSIVPALTGQGVQQQHAFLYWEDQDVVDFTQMTYAAAREQAVRLGGGGWKGYRPSATSPIQLYNLTTDPSEATSVAAANPGIVAQIVAIMTDQGQPQSPQFDIPYINYGVVDRGVRPITLPAPSLLNNSFESPGLTPAMANQGEFQNGGVTSWDGGAVYNPANFAAAGAPVLFTSPMPDGVQAAALDSGAGATSSITQSLHDDQGADVLMYWQDVFDSWAVDLWVGRRADGAGNAPAVLRVEIISDRGFAYFSGTYDTANQQPGEWTHQHLSLAPTTVQPSGPNFRTDLGSRLRIRLTNQQGAGQVFLDRITVRINGGPACGSADFNGDGDVGTDADIEAFFACLAGNCCATCGTADFNADGDIGTDADIESFFRVLGGGAC
jgi:arylsulfatase A-like enzyme